ncbi:MULTISPECIES: cardiolipin synthase [Bacillus]|uniref:Cardiolipin synthase n=2 Tax=Bacillus TaxID=1386 RepID=A0A0M4G621_9BACI|nr:MULTISPECIES: cardiolipin synthase [Bacillus]ALC80228.1 phospholipase [Bacillus gobiensis]MBP1082782.1 cardiolipin synthase [Bacillus capparidis]MED1098426.1 cardiolipin synthase [Bacillus capparidis]
MYDLPNLYTGLTVLNILLAFFVIFLERRDIGVTWAWLMVLLFLPGIGFVLYILFGQNLSKRKIYKLDEQQVYRILPYYENQLTGFRLGKIAYKDDTIQQYQDLIYMNLLSGHSLLTQDNDIKVYTDGNDKFNDLLKDIEGAKHHIHIMYYIVRNGALSKRIVEALTKKAAEGVEVRFLYDAVGSMRLSKSIFRDLLASGGKVASFFPSRIPLINIRMNYRNHRKLVIIDGTAGYIGGFNIGDEYLGLDKRYGVWRDTHIKITGSAVLQMQAHFLLDWELASKEAINYDDGYFPVLAHEGKAGMQILTSGPDDEREQIKLAYLKIIVSAKDRLYIQTPYFIPDQSLMDALRIAATSGVDVRMMIPAVPDHKLVYWASYSYLKDLLAIGVKCYLYEKGFLHAKTIIADDKVASVGTANIDIRSFKLNFEVNAFIYDELKAKELSEIFTEDMNVSRELTLEQYKSRPRLQRVVESIARLLSPIL